MAFKKGKRITIIGGKHKNKRVWLDDAKRDSSDTRVNIIVDDPDKGERATWTSPRLIMSDYIDGPPNSYAQAILQQQPKAELMINKLTRELARCNLDAMAIKQLSSYFDVKLKDAVHTQASLGLTKALYKKVEYKAVTSKSSEARRSEDMVVSK
jgi:hypothetical protein